MEDLTQIRLNSVIDADILKIEKLTVGSEERERAIDDLVKLYKLRIDESKYEADIRERKEARIMEMEERAESRLIDHTREDCLNRNLAADKRLDRYCNIGIAVVEIGAPLVFYAVWMNRGFQFEETGAYTSTTFRGLFNRFKPTKK